LPDSAIRRALGGPLLRYVATVSYALYVIHPMFAHGWWNAGTASERYLLKRPVGITLTFLLAHFSTFWWERLWTRAAAKWLARQDARRQPGKVLEATGSPRLSGS
jgi:peptidoglycan/LPS O-acetylase OafA/YrhL